VTPNQVTLARVLAAFAAVALFSFSRHSHALILDASAVLLTILAIALDGLDGYLARKKNLATPLGAQLDILGDRVVENLFFTFFAVSGLITLWVPIIFFVRGTLTDFIRGLASRAGRTGFGASGMLDSKLSRALVASRFSRAAYAVLKCACFCYLGFLLPLAHFHATWLRAATRDVLGTAGQWLVGATVAFCIVRAIPVLWEGWRYISAEAAPPAQKISRRTARSGYRAATVGAAR
jgi:CDP-diacylglycerol---glycerol-3-phosphate 3-phosphatidyltransferase